MEVTVRDAIADDCSDIRRLIQDLAEYEDMPEGPRVDATELARDGFGSEVFFRCKVAEEAGSKKLVGYVMYYFCGPRSGIGVYMEDFYVSPKYRSKGLGTRLWSALLADGLSKGVDHCRFIVGQWNKSSVDYYRRKGALCLTGGEKDDLQLLRSYPEATRKVVEKSHKCPTGISIREGTKNDLQSVTDLWNKQRRLDNNLSIDINFEDFNTAILLPHVKCHFMVAELEDSGELVGFSVFHLSFEAWKGRTLYLNVICVRTDHRRKGLGTSLYQESIKFAYSQKAFYCDMVVDKKQSAVLAMFEKLGAENITRQDGWLVMYLPKESMEKMVNQTK